MKSLIGSFIGLMLSVSVGAQPLLEGRVMLSSGQPAAGVEVMLFDLSDLQRGTIARATTDVTGSFAVAVGRARGRALPDGFALGQNYPNPFNPSTIIPYHLSASSHVRLEVFNLLGQRLATLVDAEQVAGAHTALWDATNAAGQAVSAGVYIYRLTVGTKRQTGRMVLIDGQAGVPVPGRVPQPVPLAEVVQDRPYGLVVSGQGIAPYIVPAFRVAVGMAPVDLVVEASGNTPRPKVTEEGILGDVDGNGVVDIVDALIVAMYTVYPSIDLPSNSNISLGDVNYDGRIDFIDAYLIGTYSVDPSDPLLPEGIGQAVTAADSPDPDLAEDSPPTPPANVRFEYGQDRRFRISWDNSLKATFYEVYWDGASVFSPSCPGGCKKIATVNNTSVEHDTSSFFNGYWVKACNSAGCSQLVVADWEPFLVAAMVSESAVTLRLIEHTYEQYITNIQDVVQVWGLDSTDVNISSVSRVSDIEVKVELIFDDTSTGNYLKFIVDAGAIANYNGPDLVHREELFLGADIAVELSVENSSPNAGEYIYLSATVLNLGSVTTPSFITLRYYLSTDETISTSDVEVDTDEYVHSLDPFESSDERRGYVKVPSIPGTYYYGACVRVLLGESDGTNNCSRAVPVTISDDD